MKRDSFSSGLDAKDQLRRAMRKKLRQMDSEQHVVASREIGRRAIGWPAFQEAQTVALFAPLPGEPDIRPLIEEAWARGKRTAFPVMPTHKDLPELEWHPAGSWEDFKVMGPYGLREPIPSGPGLNLAELDCVFVPGLAFDPVGNRLGRGGGFYDFFLERSHPRTVSVGLMFACQQALVVPSEPHDQKLKWVITEKKIWKITR